MNISIIKARGDRGFVASIIAILSDPYYYLMNLPSVWLVLAVSIVLLAVVSSLMVGVWSLMKFFTTGSTESPTSQPVKLFIGMATTATFTIFAGVMMRYMTRADIRGQFVFFSKYLILSDKERFVFEVIDKRTTQLIGMSITAEITISEGRGNYEFRRISLNSPGIIALPTELKIDIKDIFPELLRADCHVCGKACSIRTLPPHMEYYHGIDQAGAIEARKLKIRLLVDSIESVKIRISGVDEVSGKNGTAEYIYSKAGGDSTIVLSREKSKSLDDNFSVTTTIDDLSSSPQSSSPSSNKSAKKYVHVDFNYQ